MNEPTPEAFYGQQKQEWQTKLQLLNEKRSRIAWLRLLVVMLTFFAIYQTWNYVMVWMICVEIGISISLFLYLVSRDADSKEKTENLQRLLEIAGKEINMLNHEFAQYETGEEFLPPHHVYAGDLDILGKASLYQYINRCTSEQGKKLLADRLLHSLLKEQVEEEQKAVIDLKNKSFFRMQWQAFGRAQQVTAGTERKIAGWLSLPLIYTNKSWRWLSIAFPLFSVGNLVLYSLDIIPAGIFYAVLFACYLISLAISKKISQAYDMLSRISTEIITVQKQLAWLEKETFQSKKMLFLQQQLRNSDGSLTSFAIKKLYAILNRFDVRLNNFAFFFLNTLFLWDLHQLLALNKWKQANRHNVKAWFLVVAETEVSNSLATLAFNKPDWCIPVVTDDFFTIDGKNIGHPLLPQHKCVTNSFSLQGKGKVAIITGSNMGGKSTFLRSLGANTVLALLGAPVCAGTFSVSTLQLMSSMRVTDNLAESASTFYAELKKLQTIIEAVNRREPVFILLDEILRGTNSIDRHTGSVALLKQLIRKEAVAVIATHDVELAKLQTEYPQAAENYHFDVQAKGDELYFDYKLKTGICQSMNASILMKNIGIELG